jgi:hypothetical protein
MNNKACTEKRVSALDMGSQEFRTLGYQLIDRIAGFLDSFTEGRVTPAESPSDIRQALEANRSLPQQGADWRAGRATGLRSKSKCRRLVSRTDGQ